MDPNGLVNLACQHQDEIVKVLAWAGGTMPIASALAWIGAKWGKVPAPIQLALQALGGNLFHLLLGEPTDQAKNSPSVVKLFKKDAI